MANINLFIKENIKKIGTDAHIAPDIPEKKLNNAIKAFNCENFFETILAIYDNTIFGSSKEGLVFTGEKMIFSSGDPIEFLYSKMVSAEHIRNVTVNEKGKESVEEYTQLTTNDGVKHKLTGLTSGDFNYTEFTTFLNSIIQECDDYKEEDQLKTIATMSGELKTSYLKVIINMTFVDDEDIDEKELAEIFLLMTRVELDNDSRFEVRSYISSISTESITPLKTLLETIRTTSEVSHHQSIMISLVKDMINIYFSTKDTVTRTFSFLDDNRNLFGLSDAEIELAYDTVENDYKLLNDDIDDSTIEKNAKELAAKATAAGAPLAAVYISGSVAGMSAAGITSGLATLGMGMGMTGGLAVIGVLGVLSYKGVKHLTGANELDKYKTRELMLHSVIKQTQKTISLIIDDINHVVQKLNDTILHHSDQTEKIKKLVHLVAQFQGAIKSVDNKTSKHQNLIERIHCPRFLDIERLKSLTNEPTKKQLYEFIIENYEEKILSVKNTQKETISLKDNIKTEILDKMAEIFKTIGYFDTGNIIKGKALEGMNKLKENAPEEIDKFKENAAEKLNQLKGRFFGK
jgi:hypothetical protein